MKTAASIAGGSGAPRTNRSGCASQALCKITRRVAEPRSSLHPSGSSLLARQDRRSYANYKANRVEVLKQTAKSSGECGLRESIEDPFDVQHWLPKQYKLYFDQVIDDIEKYTARMRRSEHIRKGTGLHSGTGNERYIR